MDDRIKKWQRLKAAAIGRENEEKAQYLIDKAIRVDAELYGGKYNKKIDALVAKRGGQKEDVWKAVALNFFTPEEYFMYRFQNKTRAQKNTFCGNHEKEILCSLVNNNNAWRIFSDKNICFKKFRKFYRREAFFLGSESDIDGFRIFLKRHGMVMVKPTMLSQGAGIFIAGSDKASYFEDATMKILDIIRGGGTAIAEQLILQSDEMASFNKDSVNTVRIGTFRNISGGGVLYAGIRTGRKGQCVDNGGSGGILAHIDTSSGIVSSDGYDEEGKSYLSHPDSGITFCGFKIPDWYDALRLVYALSRVVPQQRYVGWDLAHTADGWVMVEGNSWAQFIIPQVGCEIGIRKKIEDTFYKTIRKEIEA